MGQQARPGRLSALSILAAVACLSAAALAQYRFQGFGLEPAVENRPYDGHFALARLKYTTGPGGYYYRLLPAWAHGYPDAEQNLIKILNETSFLSSQAEGNVFALDDPRLCEYPVAYMTEAGFWTMSDAEAAAFGAYLRKGGFVIFDDFRDPPRGGGGWDNFEANMRRILPEGRFVDMDPSDPIFHSFFEIESFDVIPQFYDQVRPVFRGLYDGNDPHKRLIAIANYNTDISNYWEFSATGMRPVDESNQAYKLGVNYVMYGLMH